MSSQPTIGQHMTPCAYTVRHDDALAFAHGLMQAHGVRHLPVLKAGRLLGVLSARDLYFAEALSDLDPEAVVGDVAVPTPYVATTETPLETAAVRMAERHCSCAVVTDGRSIVGVLTTVDALRALATLLRQRRAA